MKKALAIFALALFIGGTSVSAVAATLMSPVATELREDDKKKAETTQKTTEATNTETKKESSDCSGSTEAAKKSDCSKSCEGESKK